ncbi:hypothetical protein BWGOE13_29280 [Bacillus mycoides]|uniref:DUF2357 domain-containing protein n=1 Tax=Bacillus mycoides TaxID=1405 RepID=A0A1E8BMH7_BACMY|nr:DUF2357 domain-containing protein [Bacillus mycoides]OFD92215.1 hypothetical protein BWGOE11_29590 [Bacillus mycoides]OFE00046.1 hypothetical protein BWGOE13_29280 [Bacillus mycoides]
MAIHYNNTILPITLYFEDYYKNKQFVQRVWRTKDEINVENLAVIKENMDVSIKFFSDSPLSFDTSSKALIETCLTTVDYTKQDIREISLQNDEVSTWLYQGSMSPEFPWRMGYYVVEIHYEGNTYYTGFTVTPLHLKTKQIEKLHEFLEDKITGIIFDLRFNSNLNSGETSERLNKWYIEYAERLIKKKKEIIYLLEMVRKKPKTTIQGINKVSLKPGKKNKKTLQWELTTKGISKNQGKNKQYYNRSVKEETLENIENKWLKNILLNWRTELNNVSEILQEEIVAISKLIKEYRNELELLERHRISINKTYDVSVLEIQGNQAKVNYLNSKVRNLQHSRGHLENMHLNVSIIESRVNYTLSVDLFKNIQRGYKKPILKLSSYYGLDANYNALNQLFKQTYKGEEVKRKNFKKTWHLYEYFCLLSVVDCVRNVGYNLASDLSRDTPEMYMWDDIPEGMQITFENDLSIIKIWYDKIIPSSVEEAISNDEVLFSLNKIKRPDIRLDIYIKDKSNKKLSYQSSIILDAKFRRLSNIRKDSYTSKTEAQLQGYWNIFNCQTMRPAQVEKVICLYANDEYKDVQIEKNTISYIKFFPSLEEDFTVGEQELLNEIQSWIVRFN